MKRLVLVALMAASVLTSCSSPEPVEPAPEPAPLSLRSSKTIECYEGQEEHSSYVCAECGMRMESVKPCRAHARETVFDTKLSRAMGVSEADGCDHRWLMTSYVLTNAGFLHEHRKRDRRTRETLTDKEAGVAALLELEKRGVGTARELWLLLANYTCTYAFSSDYQDPFPDADVWRGGMNGKDEIVSWIGENLEMLRTKVRAWDGKTCP